MCPVLDTKCELLRAMEAQGELTERRERCEATERPGFRCDVELCPVGVELKGSLHRSTGWRGATIEGISERRPSGQRPDRTTSKRARGVSKD